MGTSTPKKKHYRKNDPRAIQMRDEKNIPSNMTSACKLRARWTFCRTNDECKTKSSVETNSPEKGSEKCAGPNRFNTDEMRGDGKLKGNRNEIGKIPLWIHRMCGFVYTANDGIKRLRMHKIIMTTTKTKSESARTSTLTQTHTHTQFQEYAYTDTYTAKFVHSDTAENLNGGERAQCFCTHTEYNRSSKVPNVVCFATSRARGKECRVLREP